MGVQQRAFDTLPRMVRGVGACLFSLAMCATAHARIDLEWRSDRDVYAVGETAEVGLYLVHVPTDPAWGPGVVGAEVIITWQQPVLDYAGSACGYPGAYVCCPPHVDAVDCMDASAYGLGLSLHDGNLLWLFMLAPMDSWDATPEGALMATLRWECHAPGQACIEIPPTGGFMGQTMVLSDYSPGIRVEGLLGDFGLTVYARGDCNRDGALNALDIDPFVAALVRGDYDAIADCNADGALNPLDIDAFVEVLTR